MLHHAVIEHEPCSDDYFQQPVEEDAPGRVTNAMSSHFRFENCPHSVCTQQREDNLRNSFDHIVQSVKTGFFLDISKKTQCQKNSSQKSRKYSKNSIRSSKHPIKCQLKTDFFLKKVLKLIDFAQKFAQTSVFLLSEA